MTTPGHRILMLLGNNPYPQDPRVRNEANALTAAGHRVQVLCPRGPGQPLREDVDGVSVIRLPWPLADGGTLVHVLEHLWAGICALVVLPLLARRPGFDVVHVHNPPDTLGLVAALWRRLGRPFVFDHHDLAGAMYAARTGRTGSPIGAMLTRLDAFCCRSADLVVATNESYREVEEEVFGVDPRCIVVVRNGPELARFPSDIAVAGGSRGEHVVCYAGVIGTQDGVDHLVRAMHHIVVVRNRTGVRCVVVGGGDGLDPARRLAADLGVADHMHFTGTLDPDELVQIVGRSDVCVEPAPSNAYNDRSTAVKLMEYMAAGRAVVAYDLPEHRVTGADVIRYVPPNRPELLADAVLALFDDPVERVRRGCAGLGRVRDVLAWERQAPQLVRAYEDLEVPR